MRKYPVLFGVIFLGILPYIAYAQPTPISACGTTITTPGSYVVTGNLTNASTNTPCIAVKASPVRIDLGGYTIKSARGGSSGIYGQYNYLSISNGTINNFTTGINATGNKGVRLENIRVISCGLKGAVLGDGAQVSDSQFIGNGDNGLQVANDALVVNCTFAQNGTCGFAAFGAGATVKSSTAAGNSSCGFGINGGGATFAGNTARANMNSGFANGGAPSTFLNNASIGNNPWGFLDFAGSAYQNSIAADNYDDGFHLDAAGATFTGNTSIGNGTSGTGYGYNVTCPSNLIGNTAYSNHSGSANESGSPACQNVNNLFP